MNKIAKIIYEIMKEADSYPHIKRKRRMVTETFDECPICNQDIGKNELQVANPIEDIWQHTACGGLMHSPEEDQHEVDDFRKTFSDGTMRAIEVTLG